MRSPLLLFILLLPSALIAQISYSWDKVATLDVDKTQGCSTIVQDSTLFVLGVAKEKDIDKNFYRLQGTDFTRTEVKYPGRGWIINMMFCADSVIYVGGGRHLPSAYYTQQDFWKYNLRSKKWKRLRDLPFFYLGAPQIQQSGNGETYVVISNFVDKAEVPATHIYHYSKDDDRWRVESMCPDTTLFHPKTFLINEELYVFFENFRYANWFSGQFMKYNFERKRWTSLAKFPFGKRIASFAFSDGANGFVGGGMYDAPLDDVYRYDPNADQWSFAGTLESKLYFSNTWKIRDEHFVGFGVYEADRPVHIWKLRKKY